MPYKDPEAKRQYQQAYNAVRMMRRKTDPEYREHVNVLKRQTNQRRWASDPAFRERKRAEFQGLRPGPSKQAWGPPYAVSCFRCGYQYMSQQAMGRRLCQECRLEASRWIQRRRQWGLNGSPEQKRLADLYFYMRKVIREQGR